MKRIFVLFSALAIAFGTFAQPNPNRHSNYLGLNVGGGYNTLHYTPQGGTWNPKLGYLGEVKYMHFFGKHFGLGFGVQFNSTQSGATYDKWMENKLNTIALTHPVNNNTYYPHTRFNDWKEQQDLKLFSLPVELLLRGPVGRRTFVLFGLGLQLDYLPFKGEFKATEGTYKLTGYFPSTGVEYETDLANGLDLRNYGFDTYDASNARNKGDLQNIKKLGVSVIVDFGFNYSFSQHWGLYLGVYGGYGLTDLLEATSDNPILEAPDVATYVPGTDIVKAYNGVINSAQVDNLHLLNVGVKVGLNIGWRCHNTVYDDEILPLAAAPAVTHTEAPAYSTDNDDQAALEAEEEAERIARCNSRRMNDPDLKAAIDAINDDLAAAEQAVKDNGDKKSQNALAKARTKASAAKIAYQKGNYCEAYDLYRDAYASIADAYAANARNCASKNRTNVSTKAADDAELYATAAHNDGLDCAMASCRNARINAAIACNSSDRGVYNRNVNPEAAKNVQSLLDQINATVNFDFNMTEPKFDAASDLAINTLCKAMAEDRNIRVTLVGHTDNIGSNESNMGLGMRRAQALKELMVKRGAPAANIRTETRGEEEPMVANDTPEHRYQNRRAVILLK